MPMKTKICGITNLKDAECAIKYGAWAIGFNFYPKSPRFIDPFKALKIIQALSKPILKVGIFVDHPLNDILQIQENLGLDLAQIYQDYTCKARFKRKMIRVIQPQETLDLPPIKTLKDYAMVLIDAPRNRVSQKNILDRTNTRATNNASSQNTFMEGYTPGDFGGTGRTANWKIAKELACNARLILAGGLNIKNINDAIKEVQPYAIDLCSGVERLVGIKDPRKVRNILKETKL